MIKTFFMSPINFPKWFHQNKAEYTGDYEEGCLLDNFIVETKRGYAVFYEHYLNANSSDYLVEFQPYNESQGGNELYDRWYEFIDKSRN